MAVATRSRARYSICTRLSQDGPAALDSVLGSSVRVRAAGSFPFEHLGAWSIEVSGSVCEGSEIDMLDVSRLCAGMPSKPF